MLAALGLPGKNDIDLDILCDQKDLEIYTDKLEAIFGRPKERADILSSWSFEKDDFEIDVILSDPTKSHVPEQKRMFEIFKSSPAILEKYTKLKSDCDGLSYAEYERKKKEFYRDVLHATS